MRVPDTVVYARNLSALRSSREAYIKAQDAAVTGRRVTRPGDDPVAIARARVFSDQKRQAGDHERAVTLATSRMQVMDGAVGELEGLMSRAREIATQGANDTLTPDDRASLAAEVDQLREHLIALANTREGDTYVFSGISNRTPALDPSGSYQGSTTVQELEVSPGVRVPLGVTGEDIFANPGANAHDALANLSDRLRANDEVGIRTQLDAVVRAGESVSNTRAQIGAYQTSVDIAASVVSKNGFQAEENLQNEVGADAFEAFSEFSRAQAALMAAVEIAGQLPLPGLVGRF